MTAWSCSPSTSMLPRRSKSDAHPHRNHARRWPKVHPERGGPRRYAGSDRGGRVSDVRRFGRGMARLCTTDRNRVRNRRCSGPVPQDEGGGQSPGPTPWKLRCRGASEDLYGGSRNGVGGRSSKKLSRSPLFRELLFLADHGIPWSVITKWSATRRMAACVAIAEERGARFDWDAMRYVQQGE
ncbi:Hypothetical protein GOX2446 [Gluconobacter oxydans 621H]|uniref:Uncharacterized protein n=1 Tax=Gluconobacter oxydans (strain 621H) TaxID=290633 RepID=Q5FN70_GLUOX|nr:Hypothetical protein GOX2446 [Gluconobacter oxydans 621H]